MNLQLYCFGSLSVLLLHRFHQFFSEKALKTYTKCSAPNREHSLQLTGAQSKEFSSQRHTYFSQRPKTELTKGKYWTYIHQVDTNMTLNE